MSLLELFIEVDDFYQEFERWAAQQQLPGKAKRGPEPSLSASEVMTIVIHFHQVGYRDFKSFYQKHVGQHLKREFPGLVSYGRFIELMPRVLVGHSVQAWPLRATGARLSTTKSGSRRSQHGPSAQRPLTLPGTRGAPSTGRAQSLLA